MWRHIRNPVGFFTIEHGWWLTDSDAVELSYATIILSRYAKRGMVAWVCYTHKKG